VWVLAAHPDLGAIGFATRGVAYLAVGGVAGRFSDRMRAAHRRQERLLESGYALAHLRAGDELAETLVRHAVELVGARGARAELEGRPAARHGDLSGARFEVPIEVRGVRHGTLAVALSQPLRPEDRATLVALALQAAVAEDNQRLLASERERAVIRAELSDAERRLDERRAQLRGLIAGQEAERRQVSYELHEQAAQTLAAVLLGLGALERRLGPELAPEHVAMLREHVDGTLRALRGLAESLRPPTLELGLKAAIERLADDSRGRRPVPTEVALPSPTGLDAELETMIYRVVEEALNATEGSARLLMVRMDPRRRRLTIRVDTGEAPIAEDRLAALAGRVELVGGAVVATPSGVRAVIPLQAEHDRPRFARAGSR
jgi:signal transduction histidine kinase